MVKRSLYFKVSSLVNNNVAFSRKRYIFDNGSAEKNVSTGCSKKKVHSSVQVLFNFETRYVNKLKKGDF